MKKSLITKEEKAVIKAYLKMAKEKDWYKPEEYEVSKIIGIKMIYENRCAVEDLIDELREKL